MESNDDDDDTPLIPVRPKSTFSSASTTHVESDDSDPKGTNAVDPDDMDFDAPDDDQSEVEVKPKSPKKAGKAKQKAEASRSAKGKGIAEMKVEKAAHTTATPAPTLTGAEALAPTMVGPTMKAGNATHAATDSTPTPASANSAPTLVDPTTLSTTLPHASMLHAARTNPVPAHPKPTMEDSAPTPIPAGASSAPAPVDPTTLLMTLPHVGAACTVRTNPVPAHLKPTMEDRLSRAIASLGSGRVLESGDEPLAKRPRLEAERTTLSDGTRAPPSSLATTPLPEAGSTADLPPTRAPSRAPSHAPSAPSRASSRVPSVPPRAPLAMPVTGAQPPPVHPAPHFYGPSDNHPLVQRPPPGMYLRGRGVAHPPYIRGGPAGRGRGGMPQSNDGAVYYDGYSAPRPAYGGEGYYTDYGYVHNYPGDPADSTHCPPYALPYGYTHQEAYPPYAAYGFGEAGPSRYADRYNAPNRTMAYADENRGVDPAAKEGMDSEGWTEVDDHSNPADAK